MLKRDIVALQEEVGIILPIWSNGLPAPGNDATIGGGASVLIDADLLINFNVSSFGQITIAAPTTVDGQLQTFFSTTTITPAGSLFVNGTHDNRGTLNIDGSMTVSNTGNYLSDGSGNINIASTAALSNAGNFSNQATMNIDGTFENSGFAAINGLLNINSGGTVRVSAGSVNTAFGSSQMVMAGGLLQVNGGAYNNEGTTTNNGTIENFATITSIANAILQNNTIYINRTGSQLTNAKELINNGTFTNESGATINNNFNYTSTGTTDNFGTWNNNGNIDNQSGTFTSHAGANLVNNLGSTVSNAAVFVNNGTMDSEGAITNNGDFTNAGTIGTTVNGFIDNFNLFLNTGLIENMAAVNNKATANFINAGTISNDSGGGLFNDGEFNNQFAGMLTNDFEFTNNNQLSNSGTITNGVRIFNNGTITNEGDLVNIGDLNNNSTGIIDNNSLLNNNGGGILTNDGIINNNLSLLNNECSIIINNGTLNNNASYENIGIMWQLGTYTGNAFTGVGIELSGNSSDLVCQDINALIGLDGEAVIFGSSVAANFLQTCEALNLTVNGVDSIIYDCSSVGPNAVEFRLEDRLGNFITCSSTVTVIENTPPIFTGCPANFTAETDGGNTAVVNWDEPTVTDNNGPVTFTSTSSPGDVFELGLTTVTYTSSTDCNGNIGTCAFNVTVVLPPPPTSCDGRVADGLIALYDFKAGSGTVVEDVSGVGEALDLTIQNANNVSWLPDCGINIAHGTIIQSAGPATKIIDAVKESNAITLEAWVVPANTSQSGPARIMTLSKDTGNRNTTLGQDGSKYVARLRTTAVNNNGMPNTNTTSGLVQTSLQHVVYTRAANGAEKFYVDGVLVKEANRGGSTSNWNDSYKFALVNEFTNNRAWLGEIYLAAVYNKALNQTEVQTNFAQGECCEEEASCAQRTTDDLLALYDFKAGSGALVADVSGVGTPLDLTIAHPGNVSWIEGCGLNLMNGTILESAAPASKITNAVKQSNEITMEAWVVPANTTQNGPARIMTLSKDTGKRNATLGQQGTKYVARFRTTSTSLNGIPNLNSNNNEVLTALQHVVYTRASNGTEKIYIDGELVKTGQRSGNTSNWEESYKFAIGNEFTLNRAWKGEIYLAAVYGKALSQQEVTANFEAGACCTSEAGTDVYLEAECAEVGSNWHINNDVNVSNGSFVTISPGNNSYNQAPTAAADRVRFTFDVDVAGAYKIFALVNARNGGDDSFWVRANNGTWVKWNSIERSQDFIWDQVHDNDNSNTPVTFALNSGTNTVDFAYREDGTKLDKIFVTLSGDIPTGQGAMASNCEGMEPCNDQVLFVTGESTLNDADQAVKLHLEEMGMIVTVVEDIHTQTSDADDKGLIVISSTVRSGDIQNKYRDVPVPVLLWEPWLYDNFMMTGTVAHTDFGNYSSTSQVVINDPSHPLAAGFSGTIEVTQHNKNQMWGRPSAAAAKVGVLNVDASKYTIFAYEAGAEMVGMTAPARRVGFFASNNSAAYFTNKGWDLFTTAVNWAKGCSSGNASLVQHGDADDTERRAKLEQDLADEVLPPLENGKILEDFTLYPNPATTQVSLDLSAFEGQELIITIYDQLSRQLYQQRLHQFDADLWEINTSEWESGIYYLQLQIDGVQTVPRKLIIVGQQ